MRAILQSSVGGAGLGGRSVARAPLAGTRGHGIVRPGRRLRNAGGFTLLELLLATAVGAIVLIVIQTTFFGALRLHNKTHEQIDSNLVIERALGIIRRDFAGIMLPGGTLSGQLQTTTFSSTPGEDFGDRVSPDLYTTSGKIDGWNTFSEAQMVAYYLATPSGAAAAAGKDLVRVVTRNLLPVQDTPGEPQVLLHGVEEAAVEFCDGNAWTTEWDSEVMSALPTALKMRIGLVAPALGQPRPEPIELTVPVFATTSASLRAAMANMPEELP